MELFLRWCIETGFVETVGIRFSGVYPWFGIFGNLCDKSEQWFFWVWWHSSKTQPQQSTLNYPYLSILSKSSSLFMVSFGYLLIHSHSLVPHFSHDLSGFLIFKLIKFICFFFSPPPSFFLPLFLLLHHNLIPDNFLQNDIVEDVT